jgi:hypothetical protein
MSQGDGGRGEDDDAPSDTMGGRVGRSRWTLWVLTDADRRLVTVGLLALVFAGLMAFSVLDLAPVRAVQSSHNAQFWLFSPMVGAVITGATLVVTINQLVLSQELGPLGDQRERMQGAVELREDVRGLLDTPVAPPEPASFLAALVDAVQRHADALREAVEGSDDDRLRARTERYVDGLTEQARSVGEGFDDAQFGRFEVLSTALDFNYSWKVYQAERLRAEHDGLDETVDDAVGDLIRVLELFGPAREHFKTLYFQWELVNLSRAILYAALPALLVAFGMLLYVVPATFTGTLLGVDHYAWVVNGATTVTLLPFALLVAYILRIATVAKRTLAIGPFVLRDTARSSDIDWEE